MNNEYNLSFADVLVLLEKEPNAWIKGKNFKEGVVLKADEFGFLYLETHKKDVVSTTISDFVINVKHINKATYRQVFNKNQLFNK